MIGSLAITAVWLFANRPGASADPDLEYFAGDGVANTAVSTSGEDFIINGQPIYPGQMWEGNSVEGILLNSRMVNGIYDDMDGDPPAGMLPWDPRTNTEDFIANMPDWAAVGLGGFTINLQGGSNRCNGLFGDHQSDFVDNNPFGANGTQAFDDYNAGIDTPHARYLARLGSIIRQADDLGMVVILGLFYFGQDESLADEAAVIAAVDATTDWILANGWTNVIIEIANESNNVYGHSILKHGRVHELMQRIKDRSAGAPHLPAGRLLVSVSGTGGFEPLSSWVEQSDFVLLHGNGVTQERMREMVADVRAMPEWQADPQPILFNEDNTNEARMEVAVEEGAGWGYYDSDEYQCVFGDDVPNRWTLERADSVNFWWLLQGMTGAPGLPVGEDGLVIEGEDMTRSGYQVDGQNSDWIRLNTDTGTATANFPSPNGVYDVTINAVAEDDGQSTLEFWVDGVMLDSFAYPLSPAGMQPVSFELPGVAVDSGSELRIVGYEDASGPGTAHARVDNITFTLPGAGFTPTPSPSSPPSTAPCGEDPLDGATIPERVDGPFAGADDDGDTMIDEALPSGAAALDCDGDGYTGAAEAHVYSYTGQTDGDQKTCGEYDLSHPNPGALTKPSLRWPSDFVMGGVPDSTNAITIADLSSFVVPVRYLGWDVGTNPGDVRWDISPGPGPIPFDINVQDLAALISGPMGNPPMLGGVKAFSGPVCPWPP